MHLLLGIDDTDVLGHKPGTGRLVRDLGAHLEAQGIARLIGVVRHQLLVDPRIPYTSHNSPACLIVDVNGAAEAQREAVFDRAAAYVIKHCAPGSDPGVCMRERDAVEATIIAFGYRASSEVLRKADALALAREHGVRLEELGGTGDGIIGALAAVGLTAEGNAGRFLEWSGGLRNFDECTPAEHLRRRGIGLLSVSRNGEVVPPNAVIETGDWVRPRLIGGRPVLLVEVYERGWRCFDRKHKHADATE